MLEQRVRERVRGEFVTRLRCSDHPYQVRSVEQRIAVDVRSRVRVELAGSMWAFVMTGPLLQEEVADHVKRDSNP